MGTDRKISGIYCIENTVNHKKYIGQSVTVKKRMRDHRYNLRLNQHDNAHLQSAWNTYGEEAFNLYIIEECPVECLDEREIYYISLYKSADRNYGYNVDFGGCATHARSNETIDAMKEAWKKRYTKVICLNTKEIFDSVGDAERAYEKYGVTVGAGNIGKCCSGKRQFCGKFEDGTVIQWRYYEEGVEYEYTPMSWDDLHLQKIKTKPVSQFTMGGEFIKTYSTAVEAEQETGISRKLISRVCLGKRNYTHGYKFAFA